CRRLCRQDPQGRQTSGSAGPATYEVRVRYQHEDRQGDGPHDPAVHPRPSRRDHPVVDRRAFISVVGGSILAAPFPAGAQQMGKISRVGVIAVGEPQLLRQSLREVGYVEGQNLTIEWRDSEGKLERFDNLAAELVRLNVDVLVASNPSATIAAKKATASIPIVMVHTPDP